MKIKHLIRLHFYFMLIRSAINKILFHAYTRELYLEKYKSLQSTVWKKCMFLRLDWENEDDF